jgi:hypothetical protein
MGRFRGTTRLVCRLSDMATDRKEQQLLWDAAVKAIGRALKHELECEPQNVPERMRELLAELEIKGKPKRED